MRAASNWNVKHIREKIREKERKILFYHLVEKNLDVVEKVALRHKKEGRRKSRQRKENRNVCEFLTFSTAKKTCNNGSILMRLRKILYASEHIYVI